MAGVKRPREDDNNDELDSYFADVTDTEAIISNLIRESFAIAPDTICRGVYLHQLYASIANKTAVDGECQDLRSRGIMKVLQSSCRFQPSSSSSSVVMQECSFILPAASYFSNIERCSVTNESLRRFLPVARRFCSQVQVLESELKSSSSSSSSSSNISSNNSSGSSSSTSNSSSRCNSDSTALTDRDIVEIQHSGFLLRKGSLGSDNVFAFSHPGLRALQQIMDTSRTKLLVR